MRLSEGKAEKKDTKKTTTKKKEGKTAGKDKFGLREGTISSIIMSVLDKKGKTAETVAKETKLDLSQVKTYLRFLIAEKKLVTMNDKKKYLIKK